MSLPSSAVSPYLEEYGASYSGRYNEPAQSRVISPRGFDGGWQACLVCLAEFGVGFQSSVQAGRIDDNRFDRDDSAAFHAIEEAGAPAGMAGDTGLIDLHQQGVQVAIDPQFDQALHLARGL